HRPPPCRRSRRLDPGCRGARTSRDQSCPGTPRCARSRCSVRWCSGSLQEADSGQAVTRLAEPGERADLLGDFAGAVMFAHDKTRGSRTEQLDHALELGVLIWGIDVAEISRLGL